MKRFSLPFFLLYIFACSPSKKVVVNEDSTKNKEAILITDTVNESKPDSHIEELMKQSPPPKNYNQIKMPEGKVKTKSLLDNQKVKKN